MPSQLVLCRRHSVTVTVRVPPRKLLPDQFARRERHTMRARLILRGCCRAT